MNGRMPRKLYSLEITTNIGCRVNCRHCPQSVFIQAYKGNGNDFQPNVMSFDLFKKCISKVVNGGTISFCGMSEPFLNPACARMIRYAYEQGYKVLLFTTLEGMSPSDLEMIQDVEFHSVCLHIPDKSLNAHINISDEYIQILKKFTEKVKINSYSCHGEIHELVEKHVLRDVYMRTKLHGRAGNVQCEDVERYEHTGKILCTCGERQGGFTPILLPDGTLLLCGNDYGMKHKLGNLNEQEWEDIACGSEIKRVLYGFQNEKEDTLCRHCHNARPVDGTWDGEFIAGPINALYIANVLQDSEKIQLPLAAREVVMKMKNSKNICIFGCGKLFHDNYYLSTWNDVIGANYVTDNDFGKAELESGAGLKAVSPDKLKDIEDLLVVTYVKDDKAIQAQLNEMGITNYVNIYDIYNVSQC